MATAPSPQRVAPSEPPKLVLFQSPLSGRCRRVEGFVAQVLQRRHNHDTFQLVRVDVNERPDLAQKFRVERVPTIVVVEEKRVRGRIVAPLKCREIEEGLRPWLR